MSKLPSISGKNCVKALQDNPFAQVVVPDHPELAKGTLRAILRDVDLSVEELIQLL
jgi:predicted RNA binding protein YcfA (HicA-like mRNA interferase family)